MDHQTVVRLSHQPIEPSYLIEDCRIFGLSRKLFGLQTNMLWNPEIPKLLLLTYMRSFNKKNILLFSQYYAWFTYKFPVNVWHDMINFPNSIKNLLQFTKIYFVKNFELKNSMSKLALWIPTKPTSHLIASIKAVF